MRKLICLAAVTSIIQPVHAADSDRDFSGKWVLSRQRSRPGNLPVEPEPFLTVEQDGSAIRCASDTGGGLVKWIYLLNGAESKSRIGSEVRDSAVKWEGAALLINTLVSGPRNYVVMDRWRLSADRTTLTVTRQVMQGLQQSEGVLVYVSPAPPPAEATQVSSIRAEAPVAVSIAPAPGSPSIRRSEPARASEAIIVRAGTRFLLAMLNTVDTKHSHEGDRVYLQTTVPIIVNGRVVIPRGTAVTAVVLNSKQPGRLGGNGELLLRFDSLRLPNGVTRDFRSRLVSADAAAAGAAAGLARVLVKRGPDASLPRGTAVEMVLDRELQFRAEELPF